MLGIGDVDGDGADAALGVAGSVDARSVVVGELDEVSGLAFGFFADFLDANFPNNSQARTRRLDRRNVRGSVHESERRIGVADGSGCELKRIFVRKPSSELRLQFLAKIGADVEVGNAGTATEPLENASAGEVGVERVDVNGDGAKRLESIQDDVGSNLVRFVDDGFGFVDVRAAKNNVRDGNDQSLLVDSVEQARGGNADAVISFDHVNPRAVLALRFPEIHDGRKVHVAVNDFIALTGEVETGRDHRLAGCDVLVERDGILVRGHQGTEFVANFEAEHPPAFFPGPNAPRCADVGVHMQRYLNA